MNFNINKKFYILTTFANDLTSSGSRSIFDELYFMDFSLIKKNGSHFDVITF